MAFDFSTFFSNHKGKIFVFLAIFIAFWFTPDIVTFFGDDTITIKHQDTVATGLDTIQLDSIISDSLTH